MELYFNWLKNYNYSKNTISNYKICLNKFSEFCKLIWFYDIWDTPEKISKQVVEMFVSSLRQNVSPQTTNLYLHAIKSYLKYTYIEEGRVVLDPKRIMLLKEEEHVINFLEKEEIEKLVSRAKKEKEPLKRVRNSLMIKMLFMTGLRVSELTNIKVADLRSEMQIIGKWKKLRTVYIPGDILKLAEYYVWRRKKKVVSEYLFISHANNSLGKKISKTAIESYMKQYGISCGFTKKTNPHALRHSFATTIYRKWALSKDVQMLLGHKHLITTEKYLRTNCEYLKKSAMLAR